MAKGRVRLQETGVDIRDLRQPRNMCVKVTAKDQMGGHLNSTRNLIKERGEGIS
jgi:hypothetical protein